jgi:hypothetical protein
MTMRVDPRRLLSEGRPVLSDARNGSKMVRLGAAALGAVACLGAFASMVVQANDDQGVLAFVRQQTRPAWVQSPNVRPAYVASPVAYQPARARTVQREAYGQREPARSREVQQRAPVAAAYAPFSGFFGWDAPLNEARGKGLQAPAQETRTGRTQRTAARAFTTTPAASSINGSRVAYCVRTCDGFYFPVNVPSGSEEVACNRLCPSAQTKVYFGQIGREIDEARSGDNGRKYAALSSALSYRKGVDKSCSCTPEGFGLSTNIPISRDVTLRAGDIVMTGTGMKVFNGGNPGREGNFTRIDRSRMVSNTTRKTLKSMERASLPSGTLRVAKRPAEEPARRITVVQNMGFSPVVTMLDRSGSGVRVVGPEGWSVVR